MDINNFKKKPNFFFSLEKAAATKEKRKKKLDLLPDRGGSPSTGSGPHVSSLVLFFPRSMLVADQIED